MDFKVSAQDKTAGRVPAGEEFPTTKAEIYQKASDADRAIKVIIYFTAAEKKRVEGILKRLKLDGDKDLILIDARKDNNPSGSKAPQP